MKLTYYGHACFSVEIDERSLLFDPFITPNDLARHIDIASIPADYILISHAHQDHHADAVEIARRTGATVVASFEIMNWLNRQGVENVHPLNPGAQWRADFGLVRAVPAIHSSSFPDGSYGGVASGFVVESEEGAFYYSGDTALTWDMKLIPETTRLRLAILCVGDTFTMGVEDAIRAADFVQCDKVLGVHFDTFPPIRIDHDEAMRKFREAGKELTLLQPGESLDF